MQLDAAVETALNVLPSNTDASSSFSLYGLLNKAHTPMGKALLKVLVSAASQPALLHGCALWLAPQSLCISMTKQSRNSQ